MRIGTNISGHLHISAIVGPHIRSQHKHDLSARKAFRIVWGC
jgi:hypothetical protein